MDAVDESLNVPEIMNSTKVADPATAQGSNRKRKLAEINSFPKKKKKMANVQYKNALMQLNELKRGLVYYVESQSGPLHNLEFQISVLVNGQKFIGRGNSKQMAKHAAAEAALASFGQFQNTPEAANVINQSLAMAHFTVVENEKDNFNKFEICKNVEGEISTGQPALKTIPATLLCEADEMNPIKLLNEIFPGLIYNCKEENSAVPSKRFRMILEVNGKKYEGMGQNKKLAKASAARAVLSSLYKISYNLNSQALSLNSSTESELFNFPQTVADQIANMLMSTFTDVMVGNLEYAKWKVIAGIAMTKDPEMNDIQIIAIGTGTKCINGEHMSMVGTNMNDCHAEIISRRCLKDFFYTNLELLLEGEADESIFIRRENGGYVLKPYIKFHLYISTAPCGDARIFSTYQSAVESIGRHPNCNLRGVLRTKIESGEGTIPVKRKHAIQTGDSILPCEEWVLIMSCSDKIASWNVLGLQGALLSFFIEPIYLDSVVLGRLFHSNHLQRALFARFEGHLKNLPGKFYLNKPKMCATTNPEKRHLSKSPNFSVNWTVGLGRAEVVNATTGKTESGQVSRLSKRSFFQRFLNIYGRLSYADTCEIPYPSLYVSFKNAVKNYREAQKTLNSAFVDAGLGCWVKKPVEQHEFIV